jgi:hypothetical protein
VAHENARKRPNTRPTPTGLLIEKEAADYLRISAAFLRHARRHHAGPVFLRIGRAIRYRRADLDAWLEERRVPGADVERLARARAAGRDGAK